MRIAILTDIHSNLPALDAVLKDIDEAEPDEIWCLGDVVGYGAQPDGCAELVMQRCDLCLVGNHDLAVIGELDTAAFSPAAGAAAEWTTQNSASETLDFLRGLEPADTSRDVSLYHASPRDPVWEYVLSTDQADECMDVQASRVSLIGHSHVALFFQRPEDGSGPVEAMGQQAGAGHQLDLARSRWLINPGSVGQPRDGDPRAAWLDLDTDAWSASYHRIPYDVDTAAEAILEAGLPDQLAQRLYLGQ